MKTLPARFFRTASGDEPVREWLKALKKEDRYLAGDAIKTVEYGWPIGMPVCRKLSGYKGLWEIRFRITGGIARIIFYVNDQEMILLHSFVKKSQKTPQQDLEVAYKRKKEHERHG